jgi:hypothetical protein
MEAGPVRSAACGIQLTADCELLQLAQLVVVKPPKMLRIFGGSMVRTSLRSSS